VHECAQTLAPITRSRHNRLFRSRRFGRFLYNALSNTLLQINESHSPALERLRNGDAGS
jgi:hypothetical protein